MKVEGNPEIITTMEGDLWQGVPIIVRLNEIGGKEFPRFFKTKEKECSSHPGWRRFLLIEITDFGEWAIYGCAKRRGHRIGSFPDWFSEDEMKEY